MTEFDDPRDIVQTIFTRIINGLLRSYESRGARQINVFGVTSDVNGTLDHPEIGPLLDHFLCDLHGNGVPVFIMTGQVNDNDYQSLSEKFNIARRLGEPSEENWWLFEKSGGLMRLPFGIAFEDEAYVSGFIATAGSRVFSTGDEMEDERVYNYSKTREFLEAWAKLSLDQKAELCGQLTGLFSSLHDAPEPEDPAGP